jgi:hypothetical protein
MLNITIQTRTMSMKNKIFGVGVMKTGLTTLGECLRVLGFNLQYFSAKGLNEYSSEERVIIKKMLSEHNAFVDLPWLLMYRELYDRFPDAKFILTVRDENEWYQSLWWHLMKIGGSFKWAKLIAGKDADVVQTKKGKELAIHLYENHNEKVKDFFIDKPGSLLVIDITRENQWHPICGFLNQRIPELPFPHENRKKGWLYNKLSYYLFRSKKLIPNN